MQLNDPTPSLPLDESPAAPPQVSVDGQELTVFTDSPSLIAAMVEDIRAAQTRVWMEVYIFADDAAGRAVADALVERAKAGLDVRLMVDALGSFGAPASLFKRLRAAGVKVHIFHKLWDALIGPLRFLRVLNQRNHRKLLVIDEQVAYFGGMNVVDQSGIHSKADAKRLHLPSSAAWRDVHVRLAGPRQEEIADVFERLWHRAHHERGMLDPPWSIEGVARDDRESIRFFDSRPNFKNRRPQRVLVPLIRHAKREIVLSIAYFIPLGRVLRELIKARRRGVRVSVVVPGQSDVKVVQWAMRHFYEYLLKRGIRIYELRDRMLHSKVMVIDGRCSVIGSCNLDARSLRLNLEFFAVIHSTALAKELKEICQEEMRASIRIDAAYCRRRTRLQRILDRAAWSFRKWL